MFQKGSGISINDLHKERGKGGGGGEDSSSNHCRLNNHTKVHDNFKLPHQIGIFLAPVHSLRTKVSFSIMALKIFITFE